MKKTCQKNIEKKEYFILFKEETNVNHLNQHKNKSNIPNKNHN